MSNKYSFIVAGKSATLINLGTGNSVTLVDTDTNYNRFLTLIKGQEFAAAEKIGDPIVQVKEVVNKSSTTENDLVKLVFNNGTLSYYYAGNGPFSLSGVLVDRILKLDEQGFDIEPLKKFIVNLLNNPSKTAVDELYLFLEACNLPITEDGQFIAYKIVAEDYKDIYTGKIENRVGQVVSMPRFEVDTNRSNTCSAGLHFCSKSYLSQSGSSRRDSDRCLLVKINPADVVSIPSDYNNSKGRTWRYEIVSEVEEKNWRNVLPKADYTQKVVVSEKAAEIMTLQQSMDKHFVFENDIIVWNDSGKVATDYVVKFLMRDTKQTEESVKMWLRETYDYPSNETPVAIDYPNTYNVTYDEPENEELPPFLSDVDRILKLYGVKFSNGRFMDPDFNEVLSVFEVSAITGLATPDLAEYAKYK